ncbi:O-antigen ligase family protein [Pseudodesulfovibrio methanolicus]|uniref:O-antigen ligase family protein n=1 Tax=Pseudodesulfovibrio methanolicus TaxID=3126690 RepID=A0ABZ2IZY4_9BACT
MNLKSALNTLLVSFVCFQSVFLTPYVIIVATDRTNLFTPILSLFALIIIALVQGRQAPFAKWDILAWLALGAIMAFGVTLTTDIPAAAYRAFALYVPALSGYWAGRLLTNDQYWKKLSPYIMSGLFFLMSTVQIGTGVDVPILQLHHHALANLLLLLAVGPATILIQGSFPIKVACAAILSMGYFACYVVGSRFTVVLPILLLPLMSFLKLIRIKWLAIAGIPLLAVACIFFIQKPDKILKFHNYESVFYRIEGIPAAIHIIKKHPLFGIGLRTDREPYLEDYEMTFSMTDREHFMQVVRKNVTEDNMLMTLLVGVGFIPTILHLSMLIVYFSRLVIAIKTKHSGPLNSTALAFALCASVLHFGVQDGLLYPQVSWLFHLLIGMIPVENRSAI